MSRVRAGPRIGTTVPLIELCMQMKLVSVNVGVPLEVTWHGITVATGIFKQPVEGRVALRKLNLDGDRQADLTVHGGKDKAVYCYPLAHYEFWKKELLGHELPMGSFGENFTIDFRQGDSELHDSAGAPSLAGFARSGGLPIAEALENAVNIGDRFSVGSGEVVVTQPRLPCYKLGVKFQMDDMVKRFLASGRTGFYLAVTREGEVGAGDELKAIPRSRHDEETMTPVSEITRLYIAKRYSEADARSVQRALQIAALPDSWKEYFRDRLGMMNVPA